MFHRNSSSRKSRPLRRRSRNRSLAYDSLEQRQLLAVSSLFEAGLLTINMTEAGDQAIVSVDQGNVTVNGNVVDMDNVTPGNQPLTLGAVTDLTFNGTAGLNNLSVQLDGNFAAANLSTIELGNITQTVINGSYVTNFLDGVLVGDNGSFAGPGSIRVNMATNLTSVDDVDINLLNTGNDFNGVVNITTGGNVSLSDSNVLVLGNINVGGRLELMAPTGIITDTATSTVTVMGTSVFNALNVELGSSGGTIDLNTVTANVSGSLSVTDLNRFVWRDSSTVGSAFIRSGLVTMGPQANVNILGDATFDVTTLRVGIGGSNTFNTGRLNFNADADVFVWENSSVVLFGSNTAMNLDIIATGDITNVDGSSLVVANIASFQSTAGISIGNAANDQFNAASIRFFGGAVSINEDSNMLISGLANFADSLILTADGTITDTVNAFVVVTNNAMFISRETVPDDPGIAGVVIGDSESDFFTAGSVSFNVVDGNFVLFENNATVITSPNGFVNAATAIRVDAFGSVTNTADTIISVETNALFDGSSINLGQAAGDNLQFGSVTLLTGGNATLFEDSAVFFTNRSFVGGDLTVSAIGSIGDSSISRMDVVGQARLMANSILLNELPPPMMAGGDGNVFNAGTLAFVASGNVNISENSSIVIAGGTMHTAGVLRLTAKGNSEAGTISNQAGMMLNLTGNLFVTAPGNITLGTDAADFINFDNLNFSSFGNVTITAMFANEESEFFIIGDSTNPNRANELRLTTNVDVRDGTDTEIIVDSYIEITARNIVLGDTATDCLIIPDELNRLFVATSGAAPLVTPGCP